VIPGTNVDCTQAPLGAVVVLTCSRPALPTNPSGGDFPSAEVSVDIVYKTYATDYRTPVVLKTSIDCDADLNHLNDESDYDITIVSPKVDCTGGVLGVLAAESSGTVDLALSNRGPWEAPGGDISVKVPRQYISDVTPISTDVTVPASPLKKTTDGVSDPLATRYVSPDFTISCEVKTMPTTIDIACISLVNMPPSASRAGASIKLQMTTTATDQLRTFVVMNGGSDCAGPYPDGDPTNNDFNSTVMILNPKFAGEDPIVVGGVDPKKAKSDVINLVLIILAILLVCCCTIVAAWFGLFSRKRPPAIDGKESNAFGDKD